MRIHHLDCGPAHPIGGALMDGVSPGAIGRLTCHCLAIETERNGVVLVDTGLGLEDMRHPFPRLPLVNAGLLRFRFDPHRTMRGHLARLGIDARDVRHIVMTHMDFDHAGGLVDFPWASVHLTDAEAQAAEARRGVLGRARYRPAQWGDIRRWHTYPAGGEEWFGFAAVRPLHDLPENILLVPLPGHSAGHAGVAIELKRGWLLHAADAYFNRHELHASPPHCPLGSAAYEAAMAWSRELVEMQQQRLRALLRLRDAPVAVFCTHDPVEYVALATWQQRLEQAAA